MFAVIKMELSGKTVYGPEFAQLSARAQNHASPERCRKSFAIIFLGDHEGVVPGEYFLVSTKLDTFGYPTVQTAPCYVQSF